MERYGTAGLVCSSTLVCQGVLPAQNTAVVLFCEKQAACGSLGLCWSLTAVCLRLQECQIPNVQYGFISGYHYECSVVRPAAACR